MTRNGMQLLITAVAAAALTSTGCDNSSHLPNYLLTSPTPTPPSALAPPVSAALDGVYRLTLTAAPSCQLPDDAMRRTYTATIKTTGYSTTAYTEATLTGAQFWTDGYCGLMDIFGVLISGNTVTFSADDCGIEEQLASARFLQFWGTATATVADTMSAAFDGTVRVLTAGGSNVPIAACTASDHQLLFERMAPTTGQSQGIGR